MTSPNKPTSKPSRVAKISVKPIWRKKPNLCNTSNVLNTTSPIPKLLTPHHEPSQENNHPNQALPNPYIKDTPTSPQVLSHPPLPISPINSHIAHTQAPPQSNNQTQYTPPLSPSKESLVDDINQLQDLYNLLAMHFTQQQNNIPSSPYSSNLPHTLNINQVETHVGYCPCCIFTQKQFLALSEDINWIEFLLTRPHPPPRVQRDYSSTTTLRSKLSTNNLVVVAPIISISFDTSEESVGSHAPRVILFGAIPVIIPVIHEVPIVPADPIVASEEGTILVVSPARVLDLVDYSPSSNSNPSEDSLPSAPDLPLVLPFLCSDDTKADDESEPAEKRPVSSSHDTLAPLSEFPLSPVIAPHGIHRRLATLVRPDKAILFGRPYLTHLNGPRKLLTTRKRVRPIPVRRLAWRRVSHHSSDRHSSPDSSSSSAPSDHSLSGHTPPDTTDANSSTP
ncbi:hypothetical protein Tco_1504642 [Tanacetum coccineum]